MGKSSNTKPTILELSVRKNTQGKAAELDFSCNIYMWLKFIFFIVIYVYIYIDLYRKGLIGLSQL